MKEKYMKDFNGEKIFCLEYDKETLRDMVIDKQEEIEKLYNIMKELLEYIHKNTDNTNFIEVPVNELLEILDKVEENK